MQRLTLLTLASLCCATTHGADLKLSVQIPTLTVAEYHRPYVAVWIEREDASVAANLAVWYQQGKRPPGAGGKNRDGGKSGEPGKGPGGGNGQGGKGGPGGGEGKDGTEWLKDLRQWWRRSGRSLQMPLDGVSGATRAPGVHNLSYSGDSAALKTLTAGNYRLVVEASRETGGRELLKLPFAWPPAKADTHAVQGETELGAIELTLNP